MRISIGAIAIPLFVCICCAPPPSVAPAPSAAAARDVDSARVLVRALVQRQRLPGFAITVSIGESSVWREGFGFADVNASVKATPESKFRIGSVSKLLTAALLMRLVETARATRRPDRAVSDAATAAQDRYAPSTRRAPTSNWSWRWPPMRSRSGRT